MRRLALLALAACHHAAPTVEADAPVALADAGPDATPMATVTSRELCKLLSGRNSTDPTPNDVQHKANVLGADLGIPVVHGDRTYLLFGDTIGFAGIWGAHESHPDAVGSAPAAAVAADPGTLCTGLEISIAPGSNIGPSLDPTIHADFAGAAMAAPSGHNLNEFIRNPSGSGANHFAFLPGDFEVPSGAFSYGDSIYVFYTSVTSPTDPTMTASYLAKWTNPSGAPSYQILYPIDERRDANGALHGHFINVAAEVAGDYVYLFGTGAYRQSGVYLARKRLDALATPGGFEELGQIIPAAGYGETSVRYFPAIDRWMLLAEESLPASNRIVAYFATDPQGPWTAPIVIHDMADPTFLAAYCCTAGDNCVGDQMFDCTRTGFYGTYLFPDLAMTGAGFTVSYTMSSFAPYNVALFQTTFAP